MQGDSFRLVLEGVFETLNRFPKWFEAEPERLMVHRQDDDSQQLVNGQSRCGQPFGEIPEDECRSGVEPRAGLAREFSTLSLRRAGFWNVD